MIEILLFILLGILCGIITGLLPGIHTNLVAFFLLAASPKLLAYFSPFSLASFIITMCTVNIFLDFIPSIYLGCPDENALSVLPGHSLLLKGKGNEAIFYACLGSLSSVLLVLLILPLFIFLPFVYPIMERFMPFLLAWVCIFLVFREEKILPALIIFLFAGILGILTIQMPLKQPLLVLLSGLFGSSSLLISIFEKTKIPKQNKKIEKIEKKKFIKPLLLSLPSSCLCSFLPGLSNSEAAALSSISKLTRRQFLILTGSINTLVLFLSLITFLLIAKARTGTALAISNLIEINPQNLIWLFALFSAVSILAFFLAMFFSKFFSEKIDKINYQLISFIILILLTTIIFLFAGILGFFVFLTSTCIGISCQLFGVKRSILMSALIFPTILLYLPI
jgi:putative membrane protein